MTELPNDVMMLLSFVNMKLRDFYPSLDAFCEDAGADRKEIEDRLRGIDYEYDASRHRFV